MRGVLPGGNIEPGAERWFRLDGAKPEVLVVFLGKEVDAASAGQLAHVEEAVEAAPASVSMPYMHHEGSDSLKARLAAATSAAATVHRIGSCEGGSGAPLREHPLPDLSGGASGSPAVVLVCASPEDTLEHEAAVLGALRTAVGAKRHLFVYASQPVGSISGPHRTLLARSAKKNAVNAPTPAPAPAPGPGHRVCDAKCKTQVKQLEAAILLFTLLVALGFGVWCMGILDAPTRFESVKEDTR
jgi:hypothetical protein